jgi:hypothetical protein
MMKKLQIASLVLGLLLFAYLIKQTGLDTLASYLAMMGWGFAFIIALSCARNYVRGASWYFALEPEHRHVGFFALTNVMLAGEAVKYLTATGPFLSEPAKAAMMKRQVPMLHGFSSLVVENMIYYLSVLIFMLSGLPALSWIREVPDGLKLAGYLGAMSIIAVVAITYLSIRRRWYPVAYFFGLIGKRLSDRRKERFDKLITNTRLVEERVYAFYEKRRNAFYLILLLNMFAHLINVVEVAVILMLMKLPADFSAGFVVEAVTKLINMVFLFVPTRAGVYESGNALVMDALGLSAAAGLALAIVRKIRAFIWVGYGLAIIAFFTIRDRREQQG